MAAGRGDQFVLKVSDNASPEVYTTIAGCRTTNMTVNKETVDITTKDSSNKWRQLLAGAGIKSLSLSVDGVFTDAVVEETLRGLAFGDTFRNFRLAFPNGDTLTVSGTVTNYTRGGTYNGEETFSATIESAGDVTYSAA